MIIETPIGNPTPLFFYTNSNIVIISRQIKTIIEVLQAKDITISESHAGVISSFIFDGAIGDLTCYENIFKAPMGAMIQIDAKTSNYKKTLLWHPEYESEKYVNQSKSEIITQAKDVFAQLSCEFHDEPSVLPLTGGLDSRLLACVAEQSIDSPIYSYTFQKKWSYETYCAAKVAKSLSIEHYVANLDSHCYDGFADAVVKNSCGLISPMHVHGIYSSSQLLPPHLKKLTRIFGYYGDPISGGQTHLPGHNINSPEALLDNYLANSILKHHRKEIQDLLLPHIQPIFDEFKSVIKDPDYFWEYWKLTQRQNSLITHLFDYHRHEAKISQPFLNRQYCDFFTRIPHKNRIDRQLYMEVGKEVWPKQFKLPTNHLHHVFGMETIRKVSNRLHDLSAKLLGHYTIFTSPFIYENHSRTLQYELPDKLNRAYQFTKENILANYDIPQSIEFPLWKSTSPNECFRFMTYSKLFS